MPLTFLNMVTGESVTAQPWQEALAVGDHYFIASDPVVIGEILEADDPGFFWVRGYSLACPDGEVGLFCVADATAKISAEVFRILLESFQA